LRINCEGVICICAQAGLLSELKTVLPVSCLFAGCGDAQAVEEATARGLEPIAWTAVNWLENEDIEIAKILARIKDSAIEGGRVGLGLEPVQINPLAREGKIKRIFPVYRLAEKLVGIPRHLGVHCGGIVVTPSPVCRIAPLEWANKGVIITQYDKDAAEAVGLVKIDLLGNRALSTVNEAIQIVRSDRNSKYRMVPDVGLVSASGGSAPRPLAFSALSQQQAGSAVHTVLAARGCRGRPADPTVQEPEDSQYDGLYDKLSVPSCHWPQATNLHCTTASGVLPTELPMPGNLHRHPRPEFLLSQCAFRDTIGIS
jgi:hypothetical protein